MNGRVTLAFLGLLLGALALPAVLRFSTTEHFVDVAAHAVLPLAGPDDLVIIDGDLTVVAPDPGGLIRPFAPLAAVVMTPAEAHVDLGTFPQRRFFLVGKTWQPASLGLPQGQEIAPGVLMVEPVRAGRPLVGMMGALKLSTSKAGQESPCQGHHVSGGVKCGQQPWQYMGPVVMRANGADLACLWSHPIQGAVLNVDVPAQGVKRIQPWLQFGDDAIHDKEHPPIMLGAWVNGVMLAQVACQNAAPGRCELGVDVPPGTAVVRLTIETQDAARQVSCLGGMVLP